MAEADQPALLGRRVVGEINLACGGCDWCGAGLGRHCPDRTVLGIAGHPGAFSEYFTLPERNLHIVPGTIPTERATFTEPLAAACEILDQVAIPPGGEVAVLGDGKLGLLATQVLLAHGARVHLYGRHPAKLAIPDSLPEAAVSLKQGAGRLIRRESDRGVLTALDRSLDRNVPDADPKSTAGEAMWW